jgi:hypothetical protein
MSINVQMGDALPDDPQSFWRASVVTTVGPALICEKEG